MDDGGSKEGGVEEGNESTYSHHESGHRRQHHSPCGHHLLLLSIAPFLISLSVDQLIPLLSSCIDKQDGEVMSESEHA